MSTNRNKVGTCKCIDYFRDNKNKPYVRQVRKTDGNIHEIKCNRKVVNGTDFCKKHQGCKSFLKSFVNKEEPVYDPSKWESPYIEGSHNCYAYFLDTIYDDLVKKCSKLCKKNSNECPKKVKQCRSLIPQPGDYNLMNTEGNLKNKEYKYTCNEMEEKIFSDNPKIKKSELFKRCPKNTYKGAMVADPGNTFHFYRQNKDGTWSHKPGTLPVTNKDADNLNIYTPFTANRDYTKPGDKDPINYTSFCGYYCIPNNIPRKAK